MLIKAKIHFRKRDEPFKGFISTWITHRTFTHKVFEKVLIELKKTPILLNIQYIKIKYRRDNPVSVSFKTEEDEAAFMLLISGGDGLEIDVDDEWYNNWW